MSTGLPGKERLIVGLLAGELCLLPWALGGDPLWVRLLALPLAGVAFLVALLPTEHGTHPLRRLGKSPGFWSCLALFGYLCLQAVNPSQVYSASATPGPVLHALSHLEFLPSGMASATPGHEGAWLRLLFPTAVMLSGLSVGFGLRRRRSIEVLLTILVLNATLLALLGILGRVLGAPAIYWCIPSNTDFVASFPYRNHAAAYYYLHCGVSVALAAGCYQRYRREGRGLRLCLGFCALSLLLALAAILTQSRTAVVMVGLLYCGTPAIGGLYSWARTRWLSRRRIILLSAICISGVLASVAAAYFTTVNVRFAELLGGKSYSIAAREAGAAATLELATQSPVFGHGLGSFPLLFEPYQRRHAAIDLGGPFTTVWPHAHNDYIEALIELGMVGCLPLALLLVGWLIGLLRQRIWKFLPASILVFSCSLLLLHAAFEYIFQSPSLLLGFIILAACILRHCHISLERERERQSARNLR